VYAIVDVPPPARLGLDALTRALVGAADGPHASVVQLRAKDVTTAERVRLLDIMGPICRDAGVPLLVNDDVEAALAGAPGVCGVHLGQDDAGARNVEELRELARGAGLPDFVVGLSTHSIEQLRAACHLGPDYVAYGPILPTRSKARPGPAVGIQGLTEACRQAWKPVVAIGGLDLRSGAEAVAVGAQAVAVIGALRGETEVEVEGKARQLAQALAAAAAPLDLAEVCRRVPVLESAQLVELARWSDDIGTHITLGLPARFRPVVDGAEVRYRPCDVLDLLHVLGKRPGESWEAWRSRGTASTGDSEGIQLGHLVQLRRSGPTTE
jgi:thiamine-phosphate pyrophosphorylase